jgi:hypothetical protein
MRLKLTSNLALGLAELLFFQESFDIQPILAEFIETYGVVQRNAADEELKVIQGTGGNITILPGSAIDKDFNLIDVPQLENHLDIPGDSVTRYVILKYAETTIEEGTVQVQSDGTLTVESGGNLALGQFTTKLRGIGAFPTKIRFPNSTLNVGEYFVRSVIDDQTLVLNVGEGVIVPESGLEWEIVGSFTPGSVIANEDKFPFVKDSYSIELRTSSSLISRVEFLLADVVYDGTTVTITDRRSDHKFTINRYIVGSS